jgi:hypothetical protein
VTPPTDGSGGQGGTGGPGGTGGGNPPSPSGGAGQGFAPLFAYLATQDEDELMKKSMRKSNNKNDTTFSIRDGGIQLPDDLILKE